MVGHNTGGGAHYRGKGHNMGGTTRGCSYSALYPTKQRGIMEGAPHNDHPPHIYPRQFTGPESTTGQIATFIPPLSFVEPSGWRGSYTPQPQAQLRQLTELLFNHNNLFYFQPNQTNPLSSKLSS